MANTLNPNIMSILAANNAMGGAPYKPVGAMGSPFIKGGGAAYTPAAAPGAGGLSFGSFGQWALPRPAGVSLGYIPTPQVIGDPANDFTPKTLGEYYTPPKVVEDKPKSVMNPKNNRDRFLESTRGRADRSYTTSEPGSRANRTGSSAYGGYGSGGLY